MCFLLFQIRLKPDKNFIINAPEQMEVRLNFQDAIMCPGLGFEIYFKTHFISGTNLIRVLS